MNYWFAEMTNMNLVKPLFDYIEVCVTWFLNTYLHSHSRQKTWVPRGMETATILYNITRGWVTHNEVRRSCVSTPTLLLISEIDERTYCP